MDDDIEEEESGESDGDLSEDLGNNLVDGSGSYLETSDMILEQTIHAASPNKKLVSTSTSCMSGNAPQLSPDPQVDNSTDENDDNDGESPLLSANYFSLL